MFRYGVVHSVGEGNGVVNQRALCDELKGAKMKTLLFVITLFVLTMLVMLPNICRAEDVNIWTAQDTIMQGVYLGLQIVDTGQSLNVAGSHGRYSDNNPVLGKHPSKGAVIGYMAGTAILDTVIAYLLPKPYRTWFQGLSIGVEGYAVGSNFYKGIGVRF